MSATSPMRSIRTRDYASRAVGLDDGGSETALEVHDKLETTQSKLLSTATERTDTEPENRPGSVSHRVREAQPVPSSRSRAVPRLALTPEEAAESLGMSRSSFREHVDAELRWIRRGRKRVCPVREIERWLEAEAERLPSC